MLCVLILIIRVLCLQRGGRKKGGVGGDGQGDLDDGINGGGGDLDLDMDGEDDLVGPGEGSQREGKSQSTAPTLDPATILPLHEAVVHSIEACGRCTCTQLYRAVLKLQQINA